MTQQTIHNLTDPDYPGCGRSRFAPMAPGQYVVGPHGIVGAIRSIRGDGRVYCDVIISPIERMSTHSVKVGDRVIIWAAQITAMAEVVEPPVARGKIPAALKHS